MQLTPRASAWACEASPHESVRTTNACGDAGSGREAVVAGIEVATVIQGARRALDANHQVIHDSGDLNAGRLANEGTSASRCVVRKETAARIVLRRAQTNNGRFRGGKMGKESSPQRREGRRGRNRGQSSSIKSSSSVRLRDLCGCVLNEPSVSHGPQRTPRPQRRNVTGRCWTPSRPSRLDGAPP